MKKTLAEALENKGYDALTPVQEAVTAEEHQNTDLLVSAQTGSGKTVGFGLAIAPTVLGDKDVFDQAKSPLALVVAPTRELALQVKRELSWLYSNANVQMASCVGGMDMRDERRALGRGAHIVVATPGRLRDHIMRGSIDMSKLRAVVLDEADEMLDLGFREDLEFILSEAPEARRTLLFSATVPRSIANLAKNYQKDAVRVVTTGEAKQHADIEYKAYQVAPQDSENAIINVLRYYEAPNAIVFCNTRAMVNRLTTRFSNRGFSVVALSGELTQTERSHALQAMRDGRAKVCIATDVAARGIDLPKLELVIHAELPSGSDTMLHRSGRTGRAGRKGVSALIVPPKSRRKAERLLGTGKVSATWGDAPSAEEVLQRDQDRLLADETWSEDVKETEAEFVAKLLELHSAEKIATAYLRLHQERLSAPEELAPSNSKDQPRERVSFGPSVWFSISGGRENGAEPRRLLPMICKVAGLGKEDIGAIRIQQKESFVEVSEANADMFLEALGSKQRIEGSRVERLDQPPKIAKSPKPKFEPRAKKPHKRHPIDTAPIDWNDDPTPRQKKPKSKFEKSDPKKTDGQVKTYKNKKNRSESKSKGKPGPKPNKNIAPLVGKSNSKKNKARRAAAQATSKSK